MINLRNVLSLCHIHTHKHTIKLGFLITQYVLILSLPLRGNQLVGEYARCDDQELDFDIHG